MNTSQLLRSASEELALYLTGCYKITVGEAQDEPRAFAEGNSVPFALQMGQIAGGRCEAGDFSRVHIECHDIEAGIVEYDGQRQPDVSQPDDGYGGQARGAAAAAAAAAAVAAD